MFALLPYKNEGIWRQGSYLHMMISMVTTWPMRSEGAVAA